MARKKKNAAKAVEPVVENPVIVEVETPAPTVEETPKVEEVVKVEENTEKEKVREQDKKIAEGAKAREEMKKAWKKRVISSDSQTNQYTYNLGSIL
jgi:hypothetical protein